MKATLKTATLAVTLAASTLAGVAAHAGTNFTAHKLNKQVISKQQLGPKVNGQVLKTFKSSCVDLAVFVQKRTIPGNKMRLTYGVSNVSRANFVSGAHQQSIALSMHGRSVQNMRFASLNAGQSRSWSVDVPIPFEIPNTYVVDIAMDPDIYIDGNTANDDCNRANNRREVLVGR